jgi:F-type H+-transporting ATPase subunit delta
MNNNNLKALFTSLPGRYARALFNEGQRSNCLDEIINNFETIDLFFRNNTVTKNLLTNCFLKAKDLRDCWLIVGNHIGLHQCFLSFMVQIIANHRFKFFKNMQYIFLIAVSKHKNRKNISVSSAVTLSKEQKVRIEKLIYSTINEKIIISYEIDEGMLGGIKLRSEEMDIDVSTATKLRQLSSYLVK